MPYCHYYKLKEDSTKKGKKKYFITIARPHIERFEISVGPIGKEGYAFFRHELS
jgi:hypothetical protein